MTTLKIKKKCPTKDCPNMMAYNSKMCKTCSLKLWKKGMRNFFDREAVKSYE